MATVHSTLCFAQGKYGWVEQFFRSAGTLPEAVAETVYLARARWTILGSGVSLYRVRVSQVGAPRVSVSLHAPGRPLPALATTPLVGPIIRLSAGPTGLYHRPYLLRGLPQGALLGQGQDVRLAPAYTVAIQAWLNLLISRGWQLQCWGRESPLFPITGLFGLAEVPAEGLPPMNPVLTGGIFSGLVLALVDGSPVMPAVDPGTDTVPTVRIGLVVWGTRRKRSLSPPNGEWVPVLVQAGAVFYYGRLPEAGQYLRGGYLQIRPRIYLPIVRADLGGESSRACGPAPTSASLEVSGQVQADAIPPGPLAQLGGLGGLLGELQAYLARYGPPPPGPPDVGPIVPVPPPFPPPPGNVTTLPEPPRAVTCNTLRDIGVCMMSWLQFNSGDVSVGIARCLNLTNTYAVFLGGISDLQVSWATANQVLEAIRAGILDPTARYLKQARIFMGTTIPDNAMFIIYGYSLGGLTAENLNATVDISSRLRGMVCFASPTPTFEAWINPARRFRVYLDLVPYLTPTGLVNATFNSGYTTLFPDPSFPFFPPNHQWFLVHPELRNYDPWGQPLGSGNPGVVLDVMVRRDIVLT